MPALRLISAILLSAIAVFLLIGYLFTYRYPSLRFDPTPLPTTLATSKVQISAQGAYVKHAADLLFRAFQPNVEFTINASKQTSLSFVVENIHPLASITTMPPAPLQENQQGLKRQFELELPSHSTTQISIQFPQQQRYRFGVIHKDFAFTQDGMQTWVAGGN